MAHWPNHSRFRGRLPTHRASWPGGGSVQAGRCPKASLLLASQQKNAERVLGALLRLRFIPTFWAKIIRIADAQPDCAFYLVFDRLTPTLCVSGHAPQGLCRGDRHLFRINACRATWLHDPSSPRRVGSRPGDVYAEPPGIGTPFGCRGASQGLLGVSDVAPVEKEIAARAQRRLQPPDLLLGSDDA